MAHNDHGDGPSGDLAPARLGLAAALNGGFGIAQIVGGLAIGSVAVLADAVHQGADTVGLLVALTAALLTRRPPSSRRTFGWGRMDAVGAQISGMVLLGGIGWLAWESIDRLRDPIDVGAVGVSVFGALGIAVNAGSLVLLRRAHAHQGHDRHDTVERGERRSLVTGAGLSGVGHQRTGGARELPHDRGSLAVRAARLHLLTDLGGSVAVLVAGVGVGLTGWERLDPVASLLIAAAAAVAAVDLIRRASDVLLDRSPSHLDPEDVADVLSAHTGVVGVHHVHLWSIGADDVALSAHVQMAGDLALHDVQEHTRELEALLSQRFGIGHTTLQVECHDCEQPAHG